MAEFSLVNRDPEQGGYSPQGLPTHEEYQNFIRRWKFLINSYMGGAQYRMGNYLTKYVYESEHEYLSRIAQTPMDNHVKSVVHIYNSFLYRQEPKRDFGSLSGTPELEAFLQDADMEGRTWESFMRDVNLMSSIYGHCVVLVDRPETVVGTKAEELAQGIRPYGTIYTPENVLDWSFRRLPSGHYELEYVRFLEAEERSYSQSSRYYVRTWTKDEIYLEQYMPNKKKQFEIIEQKPNPLGKVPAVWVYANRSPIRGIGVSDVSDIADMQNHIYQLLSEAEQLIRLTNHPTLVKTKETEASAGAGSIIQMPAELDGALKPYILQPNGGNLDAILNTIEAEVKAIDRMAHLGSIRAIETRQMSGIAQQTEYLTLDAKLCEKAKNLQVAEEQIWRLWALWQGDTFDGEIKYPMAFHIRDKNLDMDILEKAARTNPADPRTKQLIDDKIKQLLTDDDEEEINMMGNQAPTQPQPTLGKEIMVMNYQTEYHYMCPSAVRFAQKMIREGRESQELLQIVQMSDRVFQIEADVERTQTVNQQQITEATNLVNEIKNLARQLLGSAELVGYMDLHLDAIIDPTLAGTLKA